MSNSSQDQSIAIGAVLFSMFLAPNYSSNLGLFYTVGSLAYLVSHISVFLPQLSIFKSQQDTLITSLGIAGIAGLFWLIGSSFIISGVTETFTLQPEAILKLYANVQVTSPLVTAPGINLLVYGVNIPVVETLVFFGLLLPFLAIKVFKIPLAWRPSDYKMWWVILLMGVSFALFHISAHGLNDQALLVDMLFGVVSGATVFRYGYLAPAMFLHIGVNGMIILSKGVI